MPVFQTEELNQQQLSSAEQMQDCQAELLELKRKANALEIELQAQQNLVGKGNSALTWQQTCIPPIASYIVPEVHQELFLNIESGITPWALPIWLQNKQIIF